MTGRVFRGGWPEVRAGCPPLPGLEWIQMGKRFTETNKWGDKWFRALGPFEKLGWQYLCDNCDSAGVIDLDRELADFQIGHPVKWDELLEIAEERTEDLKRGKLWLTRFCDFQYGKLTDQCRPHRPVIALLQKYGLWERVLEGYRNPTNTPQEKDKEKDQDKDKEKEGGAGETKPPRFTPPTVEQVAAYCAERGNQVDAATFVDFYTSKGWKVGKNAMKDWQASVRNWEKNTQSNRGSPLFDAADPRGNFSAAQQYLESLKR